MVAVRTVVWVVGIVGVPFAEQGMFVGLDNAGFLEDLYLQLYGEERNWWAIVAVIYVFDQG